MEQMRKGNELNLGLELGRLEGSQQPFHTKRDPGHIPEQEKENLVQGQPAGTLPGP